MRCEGIPCDARESLEFIGAIIRLYSETYESEEGDVNLAGFLDRFDRVISTAAPVD